MPGDSLKSTTEGKPVVQLGKSELTGSCRYVGTPDFLLVLGDWMERRGRRRIPCGGILVV